MENENKPEEIKGEVNPPVGGEEKLVPVVEAPVESKKYKEKILAFWNKNKKIIIAIVVLAVLIGGGLGFRAYWKTVDVGPDAVKAKIQTFIKNNAPAGTQADIKSIAKEGDLYKVTISVGGQEVPLYVTRDGKKLIQQPIDLDQKPDAQAANTPATPTATTAEQKTAVPTVDLFVMSYCPYGLQMERGILPVVEALGSKIKFNLKFVSYTLHGQKEVDENVNQYCIEKTQPTKLDAYLKCFWKNSAGASVACMKTVGINAAQITSCVADANKQFNPTEKSFSINADENTKFGVQGSPTLVVNGTTLSSGRDSASILKAVCSGFTTQPKECSAALSSTSPAAGFDDQASGGASSGSNCATPQQ
jgi:hypothetical protein